MAKRARRCVPPLSRNMWSRDLRGTPGPLLVCHRNPPRVGFSSHACTQNAPQPVLRGTRSSPSACPCIICLARFRYPGLVSSAAGAAQTREQACTATEFHRMECASRSRAAAQARRSVSHGPPGLGTTWSKVGADPPLPKLSNRGDDQRRGGAVHAWTADELRLGATRPRRP